MDQEAQCLDYAGEEPSSLREGAHTRSHHTVLGAEFLLQNSGWRTEISIKAATPQGTLESVPGGLSELQGFVWGTGDKGEPSAWVALQL